MEPGRVLLPPDGGQVHDRVCLLQQFIVLPELFDGGGRRVHAQRRKAGAQYFFHGILPEYLIK